MADRAWTFHQIFRQIFFHLICKRFFISPFYHGYDAFKHTGILLYFATHILVFKIQRISAPIHKYLSGFWGEIIKTAIHGQVVMFKQCPQLTHEPAIRIYRKWPYGPLAEGYVLIWHHPIKIHFKG